MSQLLAARTDANQAEIVAARRAAGCTVVSLHRVGDGVPDLLVGRREGSRLLNFLLEVKVPGRGLNDKQQAWHRGWAGQRAVVTTVEGALCVVGLLR